LSGRKDEREKKRIKNLAENDVLKMVNSIDLFFNKTTLTT
jgi:hypothetical protein